ncbi:putative ABC transporter permease [Candidatus Saccharibacteria bacterium]|nr:putative ABC transporter permease [Candidatus Saccharibacteria bacterium]
MTKTKQKQKDKQIKDIIIQVGLMAYFTIYFVAHHFLGVFGTRWILYVGVAAVALYVFKTRTKKDAKFAEGFCFYKLFLIYVIGCMIGTYYEEILTLCRSGQWLSRQGIIYGPFNPVYGAGFLAFSALLCRNLKRKWWLTYIYSCLIGGATEMISSLIGEYVFKANAWDYSDKFLNIMGRTTIPYMLFWGAGGLIFVKVVYPALSRLIEFTPKRIGNAIMPTFMIFVLLSHVVSYAALFRYGTRSEGQPASSGIEKVLDKYYDDSFMKQYYDNPVHEKIGE